MGDGHDYQTKAEVMVLITEGLRDYERFVVEPRHRETQRSLGKLILLHVAGLIALIGTLIAVIAKH